MAKKNESFNKTKTLVFTALLFALALILSLVERSFAIFSGTIPGIKIGFSNIIVMYAVFFVGVKQAYSIAVLKSFFIMIVSSPISATMSLAGGIASVTIMLMLMLVFKSKVSYLILSLFGAVTHNVAQLLAVQLYSKVFTIYYLLPILIVSGVVMGVITSIILKFIFPAINKLGLNKKNNIKNS